MILRNIVAAFSLYSRIPMPRFTWREDDLKHSLVILPWVGAVIGFVVWLFMLVCQIEYMKSIPLLGQVAVYTLIPLVVTGGFHMDGFMDVSDALNSYESKERKLEILKDPHMGAFGVIRLVILGLVWLFAMSTAVYSGRDVVILLYAMSFFLVRAACGASSLVFRHARKGGLLNAASGGEPAETAIHLSADLIILVIEILTCLAVMVYLYPAGGAVCGLVLVCFCGYYRHMCYAQFGGVTGDTAGWFICTGETLMLTAQVVVYIATTAVSGGAA